VTLVALQLATFARAGTFLLDTALHDVYERFRLIEVNCHNFFPSINEVKDLQYNAWNVRFRQKKNERENVY
jgi:hypothetical protein